MVERPQLEEFQLAAERLREIVVDTPLVPFGGLEPDPSILLKSEIHQVVNSFKIRGVFNAVASLDSAAREKGLSTVSAGNTAQALAWAGRRFGVATRSMMPDTAPATKIEAVKRWGGIPILVPTVEVFRFLKEHLWEKEPYSFIHPWTNRQVMIGHGTIGLEILDDSPDVDTVYIPVGGGGLIGGVGGALKELKPSVRVVAVEPEGCPALHESLRRGQATSVECHTICDGVAVPYITEEMFPVLRDIVDDVILVSEERVKSMIRRLAISNHMIVEPSAALSVAAAIETAEKERGKSVCLITGGSIDLEKFLNILEEK